MTAEPTTPPSTPGAPPPQIDSARLWDALAEVSRFGATPAGGLHRLALNEADRDARDWLVEQGRAAGYGIVVDQVGNIFLTRYGADRSLAPVLVGSHLDSQPNGGRFDGTYGVLAGLEVLRALDDTQHVTQRSIVLADWTNEEGSRFSPSMLGSAVYAGRYELDAALRRVDDAGTTLAGALEQIGYAGDGAGVPRRLHRSFEVHIEQGPLLEREAVDIGIVTGVYGIRWYDLTLTGAPRHSGTTPLIDRRDALAAAAAVIVEVGELARSRTPEVRATAGRIDVAPNSRNVIPGSARLLLDFRHPDEAVLADAEQELLDRVTHIAARYRVVFSVDRPLTQRPTIFDERSVSLVRRAVHAGGFTGTDIMSGAGHDAAQLAAITPTSMLFIPCVDGISHAEDEDISQQWSANGATVLLEAVLSAAQDSSADDA